MSNLEAQFEDDMHNPYIVAKKELRYNAGYFLRIIEEHGSVGAA